MKQLLTSVVREIRTLRSVGAGARATVPGHPVATSDGRPYRDSWRETLCQLNAIKENTTRWLELLKKIKVAGVSSQNGATGSPGAYVQQSIVQNAPSLVPFVDLESCKNAGKNASFPPDVLVWHDCSLNRPPVDQSSNLFNDFACLQVIRIE